ncbi:MAG: gliding motility protein GldL [Bacteroidaceae bacterium]|nr:gliding motility protein GldL [Bacteroidaceae bacterium]
MDSARGKTVLNYLYSWGAAIVILGTLFKLTHMAGANIMLFVGMGTEVIVFFFSAFERPYEVAEEEKREETSTAHVPNGQPIIINGSIVTGTGVGNGTTTGTHTNDDNITSTDTGNVTIIDTGQHKSEDREHEPYTSGYNNMQPSYSGGAPQQFNVASAEKINEMDKVTEEYIEQVRALNEAIELISKQTEALGHNLEEMETLRRNLTGVNAIYEIQLRNASGQLDSLDHVNEQTKRMAEQVEELNALYARMIEAMTINTNRQQI